MIFFFFWVEIEVVLESFFSLDSVGIGFVVGRFLEEKEREGLEFVNSWYILELFVYFVGE